MSKNIMSVLIFMWSFLILTHFLIRVVNKNKQKTNMADDNSLILILLGLEALQFFELSSLMPLFLLLKKANMLVSFFKENSSKKDFIVGVTTVARAAAKVQRLMATIKSVAKNCLINEAGLNEHLKCVTLVLKKNISLSQLKNGLLKNSYESNIREMSAHPSVVINNLYHSYKNLDSEDCPSDDTMLEPLVFLDEPTKQKILLNSGTIQFTETECDSESVSQCILDNSATDEDKGQTR